MPVGQQVDPVDVLEVRERLGGGDDLVVRALENAGMAVIRPANG